MEYAVNADGVVVGEPTVSFASSSSFAAVVGAKSYAPGDQTSDPEGMYYRLVLDSRAPRSAGGGDRAEIANRIGQLLKGNEAGGRFAVRISGAREPEVLFSTAPDLSESVLSAFSAAPTRRADEADVYLIEISGDKTRIVYGRQTMR